MDPRRAMLLLLQEKARREGMRTAAIAQQLDVQMAMRHTSSLVLQKGHKFYDLIHKRARYKVYWGGRGSGKSWAVAEALIRIAAVRRVRVLCIREYQVTIRDSSHKILKDTIERLGLQSFFHVTAEGIKSRCGSEFIFKGFQSSSSATKHQSVKSTEGIDICWVEEAQTVSDGSWRSLAPTMRKPGSEIWVTYNLINETDPTHLRFVVKGRTDSIVHKINYDENPFFVGSPMEQEMLDDKAEDQHLYEHVWLGMPLVISDSIILSGKYKEELFPPDLWRSECGGLDRLHFGADFGYAQDPSTLIRSFQRPCPDKPDKLDLYIEYEAYSKGIENDGYQDFYSQVPDADKWPIKADAAMPGLISHIRTKWGYNISAAEKWAGSVEDGIKFLRGHAHIYIHPRCKNTLMEARLYRYKTDPKDDSIVLPIVVDRNNHAWDGVRYSYDGHVLRGDGVGVWQRLGRNS